MDNPNIRDRLSGSTRRLVAVVLERLAAGEPVEEVANDYRDEYGYPLELEAWEEAIRVAEARGKARVHNLTPPVHTNDGKTFGDEWGHPGCHGCQACFAAAIEARQDTQMPQTSVALFQRIESETNANNGYTSALCAIDEMSTYGIGVAEREASEIRRLIERVKVLTGKLNGATSGKGEKSDSDNEHGIAQAIYQSNGHKYLPRIHCLCGYATPFGLDTWSEVGFLFDGHMNDNDPQ